MDIEIVLLVVINGKVQDVSLLLLTVVAIWIQVGFITIVEKKVIGNHESQSDHCPVKPVALSDPVCLTEEIFLNEKVETAVAVQQHAKPVAVAVHTLSVELLFPPEHCIVFSPEEYNQADKIDPDHQKHVSEVCIPDGEMTKRSCSNFERFWFFSHPHFGICVALYI